VRFEQSYGGSRAQADAIEAGSRPTSPRSRSPRTSIASPRAGKIRHDWSAGPNRGVVSRSIVALAVQKGNPKGIRRWSDLAQEGLGS
jgi:sulfate transport system substrate-binding protein